MYDYSFTSEYVRKADKLYFNLSVFILIITTYLLGTSPDKYFFYWIAGIQGLLYIKRFCLFAHYGYHYFMLDWCYVAYIVQSWVFIMYYPDSKPWYYLSFGVSGLCFAIFLYTNMFVLHDIDKMTGSCLHSLPMLISWNIHWNIAGTSGSKAWGFYDASNDMFTWETTGYYYSYYFQYYFVFCVFYYGVTYIRWNAIIKHDYLCYLKNEVDSKRFKKIESKYGYVAAILSFVMGHLVFTTIYGSSVYLFFFSKTLHTLYLIFILLVLFKRAAVYYIDHFPVKYEAHLKKYDELGMKYDPLKMRKSKSTKVKNDK